MSADLNAPVRVCTRQIALRGSRDVLLTNSHGTSWRSSDSGASWSDPAAMFNATQHSSGGLSGGGVMVQLSRPTRTACSPRKALHLPCVPTTS